MTENTQSVAGLQVTDIRKEFPGVVALDSVSFSVTPGQSVALLGENGAGKSTLGKILAGVYQPSSGSMRLEGEEYAPRNTREAMARGVGMIHQELQLLPDLTVAENINVGHWPVRSGFLDLKSMEQTAAEKLEMLRFGKSPRTLVNRLSVAEQQQVEIAKALVHQSRYLIFDEPTAALGPREIDALFETIDLLKSQGMGLVYVSHRLGEIARTCDRIVVFRDGKWVASHDTAAVPEETLVSEMVGRDVERLFPVFDEPNAETLLEVRALTSVAGRFRDISFDVKGGEVFGIAGIVGAGRTELVRAIAGADPVASGTVSVKGSRTKAGSVIDAVEKGIMLVPEDRKSQGLIVEDTIASNILYANLSSLSPGGWVRKGVVNDAAQKVIAQMGVKGRPTNRMRDLSGGNQQKVVIGKWLRRDPKVIILDEPTRGIDVGARAAIYDVIKELAAKGMAVIVVSSDLDEVLGLAHRVMVLNRGEDAGVLEGEDRARDRVMARALS